MPLCHSLPHDLTPVLAAGPDHQPQRDWQFGQRRWWRRGGIAFAELVGMHAAVARYCCMQLRASRAMAASTPGDALRAGRCARPPGAGGLGGGRPLGGPPAQHLLRQQMAGVLQGVHINGQPCAHSSCCSACAAACFQRTTKANEYVLSHPATELSLSSTCSCADHACRTTKHSSR